jgi:peptide deformylase
MINDSLKIVEESNIPLGQDTPTDDLIYIYKIANKLESLCLKEKGIGIAAVQAGIPKNIYLIQNDKNYECFVNCKYEGIGEKKTKSIEGCLSLKNSDGSFRHFEVERYNEIRIVGKALRHNIDPPLILEDIDMVLNGFTAIVHQHEIDHAQGKMINHIGREIELIGGKC